MIFLVIITIVLFFEALNNFNTIYAAARNKTPWRYAAWQDAQFVVWYRKIRWGVFVLATLWYILLYVAAYEMDFGLTVAALDLWLISRICCWLLLTARANRLS